MSENVINPLSAWITPAAAPVEVTQQFERLLSHQLPLAFRTFALTYGGFTGPNPLFFGCRTDLAGLVSFYDEAMGTGEPVAPDGCGLIAFGSGLVPEVYLELASDDGRVYWGEDWGNAGCMAERFAAFLQRRSFALTRLPPGYGASTDTVTGVAVHAPDNISRLVAVLGADGVQIEPYSDRYSICGFTAAGCLLIEQWEKQACWVQVRSRSAPELAYLCERVGSVLDFYQSCRSSGGRHLSDA